MAGGIAAEAFSPEFLIPSPAEFPLQPVLQKIVEGHIMRPPETATGWRKPLSCHLFPLRVSHGLKDQIRYEKISECSAGRSLGRSHDVPLYDFLKDGLLRKF